MNAETTVTVQIGSEVSASVPQTIYNIIAKNMKEHIGRQVFIILVAIAFVLFIH